MVDGPGGRERRALVVFGVTSENVARLFADEPIVVYTDAPPPEGVGLDGGPVVVLVAGTDEDTIVATMCAAGLPIEVVHDARGDRR